MFVEGGGGGLCHGTMAQWPVQACAEVDLKLGHKVRRNFVLCPRNCTIVLLGPNLKADSNHTANVFVSSTSHQQLTQRWSAIRYISTSTQDGSTQAPPVHLSLWPPAYSLHVYLGVCTDTPTAGDNTKLGAH